MYGSNTLRRVSRTGDTVDATLPFVYFTLGVYPCQTSVSRLRLSLYLVRTAKCVAVITAKTPLRLTQGVLSPLAGVVGGSMASYSPMAIATVDAGHGAAGAVVY